MPYEKGWLPVCLAAIGVPVFDRPLVPWIEFNNAGKISRARVLVNFLSGLRQRIWGITGIIKREAIDVVHTNTVTQIEGALAARAGQCAHVWHVHESLVGNHDLTLPPVPRWMIVRAISRLSERVVGVSEALLRSSYPQVWRSEKAAVVYNGVDLDKFKPDVTARARIRAELGLASDTVLIATIGGLRAVKDQGTFIRAAARVHTKAMFLVVGIGSERERLEQLAHDVGVGDRARFLGGRSDIDVFMAAMDLLVVSSLSESFSLTAAEAMACGIPVVATRCGGVEEIVIDGTTGALVAVGSAEGMAAAIDNILKTSGMAEKYGKAGRERAESLFDQRSYTTSMERVITEAVEAFSLRRRTGVGS